MEKAKGQKKKSKEIMTGGEGRERKINNSSKIAERCTFSRNGEREMSISTRSSLQKIAMKLFHIKLVPFDPYISDMWVSMANSVEWRKQRKRGKEG